MDRNKKARFKYISLLNKRREKNNLFESIKKCNLSSTGEGENKNDYFFWEFDLKPTPLGDTYRALIIHHIEMGSPNIYILSSNIFNFSKEKKVDIPHLYDYERIKLCLYHPSYGEWSLKSKPCSTIIPWIYMWLNYYEMWLFSGKWEGGGEHPSPSREQKKIDELKELVQEAEEQGRDVAEEVGKRIKEIKKEQKRTKKLRNKTYREKQADAVISDIYDKRKKLYLETFPILIKEVI